MAENLTGQVRNIADVTTAVARGDLSKKITVDVKGEILALKDTINVMVDQLNGFASEVTRVAREVGTEGKLGGQAQVPGVGGTWKDLTDNVNLMATNLTNQVRGIADVVTVVAQDARTGAVLMVAHADREALERTLATGEMHYRSRTRGLWHKGATSGNVQRVVALTPEQAAEKRIEKRTVRPRTADPVQGSDDAASFGLGG